MNGVNSVRLVAFLQCICFFLPDLLLMANEDCLCAVDGGASHECARVLDGVNQVNKKEESHCEMY